LIGIVISPGPCTPKEAGISVETVQKLGNKVPILGVCLGHQSIGVAYGGRVAPAKKLMHGKTSSIYHNQKGLYLGINNPFIAGESILTSSGKNILKNFITIAEEFKR